MEFWFFIKWFHFFKILYLCSALWFELPHSKNTWRSKLCGFLGNLASHAQKLGIRHYRVAMCQLPLWLVLSYWKQRVKCVSEKGLSQWILSYLQRACSQLLLISWCLVSFTGDFGQSRSSSSFPLPLSFPTFSPIMNFIFSFFFFLSPDDFIIDYFL